MEEKDIFSQYLACLAYSLGGDSAENLLGSANVILKNRPWLQDENYFTKLTEQILDIQKRKVF